METPEESIGAPIDDPVDYDSGQEEGDSVSDGGDVEVVEEIDAADDDVQEAFQRLQEGFHETFSVPEWVKVDIEERPMHERRHSSTSTSLSELRPHPRRRQRLSGPQHVEGCTTPLHFFLLLFTESILATFVVETNAYMPMVLAERNGRILLLWRSSNAFSS